ncbi:MAG: helix-turn-helix domain-containing protein [Methyloligellaceae bacterium]
MPATGDAVIQDRSFTLRGDKKNASRPHTNISHTKELKTINTDTTSGETGFIQLSSGLSLHFSDIVELTDGRSESMSDSNITISILLEGQVQFYMDDQPFFLGRDNSYSQGSACGKIWAVSEPVKFSRVFRRGCRVKKVIITADKKWLANIGLDEHSPAFSPELDRNLRTFASSHMQCREWELSDKAITLAEEIISPAHSSGCMSTMIREFKALELVTLAFEAFTSSKTPEAVHHETPANCRLIKVHSYIEENIFRNFTLDEIARNVGFSVSSLQRHFKATYGTTVVDYIRNHKLSFAKKLIEQDNISITEAAYCVGYANPSSFTTAFKRAFGYPPKVIKAPEEIS